MLKRTAHRRRNLKPIGFVLILCCLLGVLLYLAGRPGTDNVPESEHTAETTSESKAGTTAGKRRRSSAATETTDAEASSARTDTAEATTAAPSVQSISLRYSVLLMKRGDTYEAEVTTEPSYAASQAVWETENTQVASVSSDGRITAKGDGNTVLTCRIGDMQKKLYVNVVTDTPGGSSGTLSLYNDAGKLITYTLYHQSAHTYGSHSAYLAWHGCAHCSLSTVLGAYSQAYSGIAPDEVINGIEKTVVGNSAWTRQHVTKSAGTAMPLSLSGISAILNYADVSHEYIRTYEKAQAREDILAHLHTGNAVLFEVRKKSNITGKKDSKWTGSVHTMVFLGVYTDGQILVADSVNHSWYSGGQRAKIASIDDLMEYMYPCTGFNTSLYFKSIASDGGYMKINP